MKERIAIAVSGGIDSLTAAYILKSNGFSVVGIHFITGYEDSLSKAGIQHHIGAIGDQLGIDVELLDCKSEFQSKVIDYFVQTYKNGRTPNPCLVCNPVIKFGLLLSAAQKLGAEQLATGHYACIRKDKNFHLIQGADHEKEQSYFLAFLSQEKLARACFPLDRLTKDEVRKIAAEKGIKPFVSRESQDVCFIHGKTCGEFLAEQGIDMKPGIIEDISGRQIGEHKGLHLFTIGQRRGINCPASEPYYVVRIDIKNNRLIVGFKNNLLASECRVAQINWIQEAPKSPIPAHTRLRYRHKGAPSIIFPQTLDKAIVRFETPQPAVTPGQGAVFYVGHEVIGGGWIE